MVQAFRQLITLLLILSLGLGPVTAEELTDMLSDTAASLEAVGAEPLQTTPAPSPAANPSVRVRLADDGSLAGRFRVVWPTGKVEPADATIAFKAAGGTVDTAETNDLGHFVVEGLSPGDYVATATIPQGAADFDIEVLAHDTGAAAEEMFMDATLTPTPEIVEGGIVVDGAVPCPQCGAPVIDGICATCGPIDPCMMDAMCCEMPMAPTCGGFSGGGGCGGGCGGGGGLGWLLGAAGLAAGITALALNDDNDNRPASPSAP